MFKKIKETTERTIALCDLCAEPITDCIGNTVTDGEKQYLVHIIDREPCLDKVVLEALKKKKNG